MKDVVAVPYSYEGLMACMSSEDLEAAIVDITSVRNVAKHIEHRDKQEEGVQKLMDKYPPWQLYQLKQAEPSKGVGKGSLVSLEQVIRLTTGKLVPVFTVLVNVGSSVAGMQLLLVEDAIEPISLKDAKEYVDKLDEEKERGNERCYQ